MSPGIQRKYGIRSHNKHYLYRMQSRLNSFSTLSLHKPPRPAKSPFNRNPNTLHSKPQYVHIAQLSYHAASSYIGPSSIQVRDPNSRSNSLSIDTLGIARFGSSAITVPSRVSAVHLDLKLTRKSTNKINRQQCSFSFINRHHMKQMFQQL